jgi:hypothetical protein
MRTGLSLKARIVLGWAAILSAYGVVVVLILARITMVALSESLGWYFRGILDPRAGGKVLLPLAASALISGWGWWSSRKGHKPDSTEGESTR